MRHRRAGRKLNRNASHRLAMFRNMCRSLIEHESIRTTVPKAKELRPIVEKLITLARKAAAANDGTPGGKIRALHYRRQAIMKLGPTASSELYDKEGEIVADANDTVLKKLFNVLGPRFASRPGGYTRVLKLHERRLGDAGEQAIIEFLRDGEAKVQGPKAAPQIAPAPALVTTAPALPAAPAAEATATPGGEPPANPS